MAHECPHDGTPAFGCSQCYAHLKARAMNGGRDRLSPDELAFVGISATRAFDTPGGWHQPNTAMFEIESILSAEDSAMLQALMNAGHPDRVEFMGT